MKNKAIIGGIIVLILLALLVFFCFWAGKKINDGLRGDDPVTETIEKPVPEIKPLPEKIETDIQAERVYLAFGNPSGAKKNNFDNYLLINRSFALSYNNRKGTANWAAWRITKSDLGEADRQNDFRSDERLPAGFVRIKSSDYTRSGYDRGHLVPSADRTRTPDLNSATFLMTNIIPQTPDLNRVTWEGLESYARRLVDRTNLDLYVIAGVYGEKKTLKRKLTVPANVWKIIVAVPQGKGIESVDEKSLTIAVDMPNIENPDKDWRKYRTTIRSIEQKTGYNFLSTLPPDLQNRLETRIERK
jgi:endonuclease G, mitochondrial